MFPAFCTVAKDDGERLDPRVFAVALDDLIEHGFSVVPLARIEQTQRNGDPWTDANGVGPNQGECEVQCLVVSPLSPQQRHHGQLTGLCEFVVVEHHLRWLRFP